MIRILICVSVFCVAAGAAFPAPPPPIHVQGRHFVDDRGNCVRMGGVMQSINSYFNDSEWGWGSDDHLIPRMLEYYDKTTKALTDRSQGCYANMVRLTDDGWWTQDDNLKPSKDAPHFYACDWSKYDRYVEKVLVPVTTNAVTHGLYVIIRPSYNTPGDTKVGDDYQKHLLKEWEHLASNKTIKKFAGRILFELENEPVKIEPLPGKPRESALADYMQPMIDVIREKGFRGPILAPGLCWQSHFEDYAKYPVRDGNLGYAVHAYPGWFDQNDDNWNTDKFAECFRRQVPMVDFAPIVVTEVDWSPIKPGKGKTNEWGQWVGENWGTWGTGSSSKWGRAYIETLERFGNISTLAGDARVFFEVKKYLETGRFELSFGGEKECCAKAFADLFRKWANAPRKKAPKTRSYRNPVVYADCPDPSMCRAGEYVYMVSTTMHMVPGAPVMRSKDMVHWEIVSYIFDKFDFKPEYSFEDHEGRTAYGGGQWAPSLVYHEGKFYAWFIANGSGGFMYTADKAEGPWKLLSRGPYLHDGSLVFDDDGKVYIFHGSGHVTEMKPDLTSAKEGGLDRQLFERGEETALLEGSAAFKKDGYYYLMMVSCFLPNHPRREVCYRSRSLTGEWEKKVILETEFESYGGVGQGCVVECPDGKWRALVFQDRGGIGRIPMLMPVTWKDGWPMLGDKSGRIPNDFTKPYPSVSGIVGSDGFKFTNLDLKWQWNHNPIDGAWSLKDRKGWLRLKAAKVADSIFVARNTLTQRMVGPACEGEIRIDVSRMKDGDRAGLAAFQSDSAVLAVVKEGAKKRLVMSEQKSVFGERRDVRAEVAEKESVELKSDVVFMRVRADFREGQNWAEMDWSLDRKEWRRIGTRVPMNFDWQRFFVGSRFAIFCYPTKSPGGYVDVDYFRFSCEGHEK